jgi:hypothetical protein
LTHIELDVTVISMATDVASTKPADESALLVTGAVGRTGGNVAQLPVGRSGGKKPATVLKFIPAHIAVFS